MALSDFVLVSVWHVPARCTLGPRWIAVCFCWSAGPHIWATCVFETESPNETHIGTQNCCVCSCIPGSRLTGWQKKKKKWGDDCHGRNGILGIIWWTPHCYSFISFFTVWNSLKALLLCLFPPCLAAVTVLFWQRAAVSHWKANALRSFGLSPEPHARDKPWT